MATREICKLCYHPNRVGFRVPDDVWCAVVPEAVRDSVVCLSCFTRLADEALVRWDREIEFFPVSAVAHASGCTHSASNDVSAAITEMMRDTARMQKRSDRIVREQNRRTGPFGLRVKLF